MAIQSQGTKRCRVFISYSRVDLAFAQQLVSGLIEDNFEAYLDKRDILPGEPWQERLGKLIEAADAIIFILSPDSVASSMCEWEINESERLCKRIVPVVRRPIVDSGAPHRLRRLNYIFMRDDEEWNQDFASLTSALLTDIGWIREHTRLGELANRWAEVVRTVPAKASSSLLRGAELLDAELWISKRPSQGSEITEDQRTFVFESRKAETLTARRTLRRTRYMVAGAGLTTVLVASLTWFFYDQWREAQISQSRFLAEQAARPDGPIARDAVTRSLLALAALPDENSIRIIDRIRPYVPPAEHALSSAVSDIHEVAVFNQGRALQRVSIPADGARILTTTSDGAGRIWNRNTGALEGVYNSTSSSGSGATFSPDGMRLFQWSGSGGILFDTASGRKISQFAGTGKPIQYAAIAPGNAVILTASEDGHALLWDSEGRRVSSLDLHSASITHATFSRDGRRLATGSQDNTGRLWSLPSGMPLSWFKGHSGVIDYIGISPDGRTVVTASRDRTARLWEARSGKTIHILKGHGDIVNSANFSADGSRVLTGSDDGTAKIWDTASGRLIATLAGHKGPVVKAAFSLNGKYVATASRDYTANVWDIETGERAAILAGHQQAVVDLSFSADGQSIVTASLDGSARIWKVAGRAKYIELSDHAGALIDGIMSPAADRLVTLSNDKSPRLWAADTGKLAAVLQGHEDTVRSVQFDRTGKKIVTGSVDGTARVWSTLDGRLLATLSGHGDEVGKAIFNPQGNTIATASNDKSARTWDAIQGAQQAALIGHQAALLDITYSPDGRSIATGSRDGTARIWDAGSGQQRQVMAGGHGSVDRVIFSPDGALLLTISSYRKVAQIWDSKSGKARFSFSGHTDLIVDGCFISGGSRFVTASWDKTARIWNTMTGQNITVLTGHQRKLSSVDCSSDGRRILTASLDGTVKVWTANSAILVGEYKGVIGVARKARYALGGRQVTIVYEEPSKQNGGSAVLWPAFSSTRDLINYAKNTAPRCLTIQQRQRYYLPPAQPGWCAKFDGGLTRGQ